MKDLLLVNRGLLIAGTLSGILSYAGMEILSGPLSWLPLAKDSGSYWPGFVFGVLLFAPRVAADRYRWLRRLAAVVVSTLLYYLTVQVAVMLVVNLHLYSSVATTVAALLGAAAICIVARWLVPLTITREAWRKAAIFGALGGAVFGISTGADASRVIDAIPFVLGLIIWQAGVAFALFRQSSNSK